MAMMFSTIDSEMKLSETVKAHPILYDKTVPGFHLKEEKNATWDLVAQECGLKDGTHAYTQFTNLRTKYGRKKGALKAAHVAGAEMEEIHKVSADYEKYRFMEWIRPYMNERNKRKSTNIYIVKEEYSNADDGEEYSDDKSVTECSSPVDITVQHLNKNSSTSQKYPSYIEEATADRLLDVIGNQDPTTTTSTTILNNDATVIKRLKLRHNSDPNVGQEYTKQKTLSETSSSFEPKIIRVGRNEQTRSSEEFSDDPHIMFSKYVASELRVLGTDAQDLLMCDINTAILKAKKYDRAQKNGEI